MSANHTWFRRPARHANSLATRLTPRPRFRPRLGLLEERIVPATLADVVQAYNTGVSAVGTAVTAAAVVDNVLGVNSLPLLSQTLDQGLSLANDFLQPFKTTLNQA